MLSKLWFPPLVFLLVFALYFPGISPNVFGGDSGDIILASWFAGVAHPPGYPINTILGFIFSHLPIGASVAYRVNLMAAFLQALAICLTFIIITKLTSKILVAIASCLTLAFIPLFWLYAHTAEVFQLMAVLVAAFFIFLLSWWQSVSSNRPNIFHLFLAVVFFSMAAFHHHTALLLVPAFLFVLIKTRKKIRRSLLGFLVLSTFFGLVPYLFILWTAGRHTPVNWDSPTNLTNLLTLITRADYGTFSASSDLVGFSTSARIVQLVWYFKVVRADFTIIGISLIIAGLIHLFVLRRQLFWFFALSAFFSGPFFLFYASFPPTESFVQGVSERFLLLHYLTLVPLIAYGMIAILQFGSRFIGKKRARIFELTTSLGFFLIPLVFVIVNWYKADLSDYQIGKTIASDVLSAADPAGIIFLQGDTLAFNTLYSYWVEGENSQSRLLLTGRLRRPSYWSDLAKLFPDLVYGDYLESDETLELSQVVPKFIAQNYDKWPIYSIERLPVGQDYVWVQEGALARLYKKEAQPDDIEVADTIKIKMSQLDFDQDLLFGQYRHFFTESLVSFYGRVYVLNAFELLAHKRAIEAQTFFNKALNINENDKLALLGLAQAYGDLNQCKQSEEINKKLVEKHADFWQGWQALGMLQRDCFKDDEAAQKYFDRAEKVRRQPYEEPIEI